MNLNTNLSKLFMGLSVLGLFFSCTNTKDKVTLNVNQIDKTVNPAEDFYHYANNGWINDNPLPADESVFGSFNQLDKETNIKVKNLIVDLSKETHQAGSIGQKIGDFYATGMDTIKIEEQGITPLKAEFEKIDAIKTIEDVQNHIAYDHHYGISTLFGFYGSADAKNSEMTIAQLGQGGLGMSDRDYYTEDDTRSKELRVAYVSHLEKMLNLIGVDENQAKDDAQTIMSLETRLAKASMTRLEQRDPHKTYNKMSLQELQKLSPEFNWTAYFKNMGLENPGDINIAQVNFFKEISTMQKDIPVNAWKTYFKWNLINSTANYLSSDFVNQDFEFYGKFLSGREQMRPRWRRVLSATNGALGEAIGQKFTEKHFPAEAKERMVTLVNNLKDALAQRFQNLEWMSEVTKDKALEKLSAMNVKIGYPDKWKDYSNLEVSTDSYVQNILNSRNFSRLENLEKIGKPVDKTEWFFPPQTVNAYYAPSLNEICFPAGILQPPFFYIDGDDAINYGAIGAVIGHEMTHGFDDQGRQFTKEGNLENWWTEEDSKKFNDRAQVLIDQFDNIIVIDSLHADGKLTIGENIADFGGLNIAYTAFKNANGENNKLVEGYTPNQRFFLSWARVWAQNIRDKAIIQRTKEDVHSIGINRVNNPLSNMPEFYNAFNVKEGDKLYKSEEKRASIW